MKFNTKHSPKTLSDVIFADSKVKQTLEDYANNRCDKHLLLYGPQGTGKSVSANIVLRERLGASWQPGMDHPFNAKAYQEKHGNFDVLLNQWNWQHTNGAAIGCSVIDEIDQFTVPMQHKLRAFVDSHESGTLIATTNNLHLVDGPLKDRFRCVMVEYPSTGQWVPRFVQVLKAEGISVTDAQAQNLLQGFAGSGRGLDDWMEEYVLRLNDAMSNLNTHTRPQLTNIVPQQPFGNTINGSST